jgi:hypothetical protein
MHNMQMQRWCCHQIVLSPMSNRASPSPATLKSRCASADNVGLIDGTVELATEVCCDDRTHDHVEGASMCGSNWFCSSRGDYATNSPNSLRLCCG